MFELIIRDVENFNKLKTNNRLKVILIKMNNIYKLFCFIILEQNKSYSIELIGEDIKYKNKFQSFYISIKDIIDDITLFLNYKFITNS